MDIVEKLILFSTRAGFLRCALAVLVLVCLPLVFFSWEDDTGWRVIPVHVAPVLALLLMWILAFDMLMSRVFMGEQDDKHRDRYRTILKLDSVLLAALLLSWGPVFVALLSQ